jgi:hypothetical protein
LVDGHGVASNDQTLPLRHPKGDPEPVCRKT